MRLGLDVGSTTVKLVLLNNENQVIYKRYERHMSNVFEKVAELLKEFSADHTGEYQMMITGSGGLSLAKRMQIPFEQEVVACSNAVETLIPQTNVVIELGGEDAKITFYDGSVEQRMNGTCAGGTGAFIDQMALLLNTDADGLNEAAKNYTTIYPIAARCGVFAKTDIQPLINEGAAKEDLAVSILQAVVNQTISGLACGRTIKGNVAFLGGPLSFLSELRKRFAETLKLSENQVIFPDDAKYYVAIGAALLAENSEKVSVNTLIERLENGETEEVTSKHLPALFDSENDYNEFVLRHSKNSVKIKALEEADGTVFLGIDAGSTTTKAALIDEDGNLLYTYYSGNEGNPVETARGLLKELYSKLPDNVKIGYAVTTGYGEDLLRTAFHTDYGEIETVAHYTAAKTFLPNVDFILDIGGQDMKCIRIKDGAINSIMLNEACSSGCGSFLETYAKSVNMTVQEFAKAALMAQKPVDLGTRCTVFMNSMVKQAQKEGATVGDIAAGLCYSVIRNALYKVIKFKDSSEAGENIVVQGGTFLNDAVLRSIENILDRKVVRPDIAGTMGAYGAALIGLERWKKNGEKGVSSILSEKELDEFTMESKHTRCGLCSNNCQLTISKFGDGSRFITGNRCERGAGKADKANDEYNLFQYKYNRLFNYKPLDADKAPMGEIGIPRALNMYENYPFWFTFFTSLGFRVILSPPSSKEVYSFGMDTISSDTACYPAKLMHGHIRVLIDEGVKTIFYPSINYERKEDENADNHYNCPVVAMYPEVIGANMDDKLNDAEVRFMHPFLPYDNDKRLAQRLYEEFKEFGLTAKQIKKAVTAARKEDEAFKEDIRKEADRIIDHIEKTKGHAIVLAGRPYHLDPEINHGIDTQIAAYGFAVLTEASVAERGKLPRPIRVLDQWTYHSRLYKAAAFCASRDDMDLVQLNSFGCGLDAVTTDQVEEILNARNKLYTVLKIDEGSNLGAARIRIRSLKAAIEERRGMGICHTEESQGFKRAVYTKKMKGDYTLIIPQMAPMQFDLIETAFNNVGYNARVLPAVDKKAVEVGLKYVNNDACYPTIVTVGQIISALLSGDYDLNKTAVMLTQTGGGCRASNYIAILRRALKQLGMEQIPVVSLSYLGIEKNPGFKFTPKFLVGILMGALYGDLFMRLTNKTRPYEATEGSVMRLYEHWNKIAKENVKNLSLSQFKKNVKDIVADFDNIPLLDIKKPKVGVVGEILVKYHPNANNDIVNIIEQEGGEAVVPDLVDFFMYCLKNADFAYEKLSGSYTRKMFSRMGISIMNCFRKPMVKALEKSERFEPPMHIDRIAEKAERITSLGTQCGEGWILTGEMMELIDSGVENIACLQPFACLPNHVVGKGMIKPLKKYNPLANIVAIDYDPGASEVNQLNRIKLMMATAHKNLKKKEANNKNSANTAVIDYA